MTAALESSCVEQLSADTTSILLDVDSTDDETHGYHDHNMYHSLLMDDGGSGELINLTLRPGKTSTLLKRITRFSRVLFLARFHFADVGVQTCLGGNVLCRTDDGHLAT